MTSTGEVRKDALYELAESQDGFFTAADAQEAGYSSPLLRYHLARGHFERSRRGIYRLVHYPRSDYENLVVWWLWSERASVFSHETALFLQELSDALPARSHLTLPLDWRRRRRRVPDELVITYRDVPARDRGWVGPVPVTHPLRTIRDCLADHVDPILVRQAIEQAAFRGLVSEAHRRQLERELEKLGF
ncbi:MAG: type IV toxin-antitoxin system AbiEi family antitoxin domain-containing protein [Armatimonadetes bacterium]|nr:type IV toxin-antitoxin system AbiEi family antitoxin domain-containing protein [Armatimonadota bacterium]